MSSTKKSNVVEEKKKKKSPPETDITIYGCTSFVAKHVITYFVQSSIHLNKPLKITLAGRNAGKVSSLLQEWTTKMGLLLATLPENQVVPQKGKAIFDSHVAECHDAAALAAMAARTAVVLNCAGPYTAYGSHVVAACAACGTDYVDITGEVSWVAEMRRRHGAAAADSGARIVCMSGYDSVPSDLSVFAAVQALRKELPNTDASNVRIERATTWHTCFGGLNGGTIKSGRELPIDWRACLAQWPPYLLDDPLALVHPATVQEEDDDDAVQATKAWRQQLAAAEWTNQLLPMFHSFLRGGASAPHFMAAVNAKVVHASAVALRYGGDPRNQENNNRFVYYERFLPAGFRGTTQLQTLSLIPALVVPLVAWLAMLLLRLPVLGPWLAAQCCPPPGSGPSDPYCAAGYCEVYAEVRGPVNRANGRVDKANCFIKFQGDPSNFTTAQCVCEAALALALADDCDDDDKRLPPRSRDGFGTPAELLGNALLLRLRKSPVRKIQFVTHVRKNTRQSEWQMYP